MRNLRLLLLFVLVCSLSPYLSAASHWVGTWGTAPQLVEPGNMPPAPGLTDNSLRQVVRVSIGGKTVRLRLCNAFGKEPVTIRCVQIARSTGGSSVEEKSRKTLRFGKKQEVTLQPGESLVSDPVRFKLSSRADVAITMYFGQTSASLTGHPGSRTTSYLMTGNDPSRRDFSQAVKTDHWYLIQGLDVLAPMSGSSMVVLGNSITDGRGSETNQQNRWPDILSERLLKNPATQGIGVLNMGIGGNCVLRGGLGPTALNRFDRDVLGQSGVSRVVVFIGVNDIGGIRPDTPEAADQTAQRLIEAYKGFIEKAHAKGLKIYGATIMPFKGNGYYTVNREACRTAVNNWIRTSGAYDGVIDFDRIMEDPAQPATLPATMIFQNDYLHPNAAGYRKMGESVDLNVFK
jgi:lysophospholipase L1-like esterase